MEDGRAQRLECAGRSLAAALAHKDPRMVATLLRMAATYLDGISESRDSSGRQARSPGSLHAREELA